MRVIPVHSPKLGLEFNEWQVVKFELEPERHGRRMETPKRNGRDPKRWLDIQIEHRTRGRAVDMLLWCKSLEVRILAGWIEL